MLWEHHNRCDLSTGSVQVICVVGLSKVKNVALALLIVTNVQVHSQEPPGRSLAPSVSSDWEISLVVDGYLVPDEDDYVNPSISADHGALHLEARYNYENLRTGSVWIGRNFSAGKKLVLNVTPMMGGIFGRTNGIAPGCVASLSYKRAELSISSEYVFDLSDKDDNFYYSWPELTYAPTDWLRVGLVAQHTKPFKTELDVQRGFLVGFSHKHAEFTAYIFNAGWIKPTFVLEAGWSF
jgi:hypothetical protein